MQAAINAAAGQLPASLLTPPTYRKTNPADTPILLIALSSDTLPITTVSDYANSILAQKISQMPGVGLVGVGGLQSPSIHVQLNPAQLAAENLDLEDVRAALTNATVNQPKGQLYGNQQAFALQTNDQLMTAKGFEDVILAYRDGAPIRVRDVGRAVTAPEDPTQAGWLNTKRAVVLAVQRQPSANVVATVDAIKAALPQLEASLPPSIKLEVVSDRTQTIRASVSDVQFTLMLTIALVVGVIAVFLRKLWATVIPAISVPISLVGTFAVMLVLGYSLDNLSLMALTIAVGFVVDDAIVMVENVVRHMEEGASPDAGGARWRPRDRVHDPLDLHLARGGVHPALPDERRGRPAVPRVRGHRRRVHPGLGVRVAHADADDVRGATQAEPRRRTQGASPARWKRSSTGLSRSTTGRWWWRCGTGASRSASCS